jgi:hypothetical protein
MRCARARSRSPFPPGVEGSVLARDVGRPCDACTGGPTRCAAAFRRSCVLDAHVNIKVADVVHEEAQDEHPAARLRKGVNGERHRVARVEGRAVVHQLHGQPLTVGLGLDAIAFRGPPWMTTLSRASPNPPSASRGRGIAGDRGPSRVHFTPCPTATIRWSISCEGSRPGRLPGRAGPDPLGRGRSITGHAIERQANTRRDSPPEAP